MQWLHRLTSLHTCIFTRWNIADVYVVQKESENIIAAGTRLQQSFSKCSQEIILLNNFFWGGISYTNSYGIVSIKSFKEKSKVSC